MNVMLAENWWLVVAALLIGVLVAWWVFSTPRRTTITRDEAPDVGKPGKAQRNHALIDSPRDATQTGPAHDSAVAAETIAPSVAGMGGIAAAATAAATMQTESESGQPDHPNASPDPTPKQAQPVEGTTEDDLTAIKGLGPRISARLKQAGITRFAQIAAWSDDEITDWDTRMNFKGRVARDRWVDQARLLGSGDTAAYEVEFGKL